MRILYVEDNQANHYLVKRVARGHEVINYIDAEEALANFERDKPDMVLMDIQLAGPMSGLEMVKKLRSDGYNRPIIAVTAYAMVGDKERCLAAGCDEYLAKPLPIPEFLEILTKYDLSQVAAAPPAQTAPSVQASPLVEPETAGAAPPESPLETETLPAVTDPGASPNPEITDVLPKPASTATDTMSEDGTSAVEERQT